MATCMETTRGLQNRSKSSNPMRNIGLQIPREQNEPPLYCAVLGLLQRIKSRNSKKPVSAKSSQKSTASAEKQCCGTQASKELIQKGKLTKQTQKSVSRRDVPVQQNYCSNEDRIPCLKKSDQKKSLCCTKKKSVHSVGSHNKQAGLVEQKSQCCTKKKSVHSIGSRQKLISTQAPIQQKSQFCLKKKSVNSIRCHKPTSTLAVPVEIKSQSCSNHKSQSCSKPKSAHSIHSQHQPISMQEEQVKPKSIPKLPRHVVSMTTKSCCDKQCTRPLDKILSDLRRESFKQRNLSCSDFYVKPCNSSSALESYQRTTNYEDSLPEPSQCDDCCIRDRDLRNVCPISNFEKNLPEASQCDKFSRSNTSICQMPTNPCATYKLNTSDPNKMCPTSTKYTQKDKGKHKKKKKVIINPGLATCKCTDEACTCHFPPAFHQYIQCTGTILGNCNCAADK